MADTSGPGSLTTPPNANFKGRIQTPNASRSSLGTAVPTPPGHREALGGDAARSPARPPSPPRRRDRRSPQSPGAPRGRDPHGTLEGSRLSRHGDLRLSLLPRAPDPTLGFSDRLVPQAPAPGTRVRGRRRGAVRTLGPAPAPRTRVPRKALTPGTPHLFATSARNGWLARLSHACKQ
jgi:hypothetical protein